MARKLPTLTTSRLKQAAKEFAVVESTNDERAIYGVTDGKAIGTYVEHKFRKFLHERYDFESGNSAKGIDFPSIDVDMKVTSIRQPQSSCPYKSASQKIFGLGYSLLVTVYDKSDDPLTKTGRLNFLHVLFVEASRTADYQMTRGIQQIVSMDGNRDDLIAFFQDKNLPVDEIEAAALAEQVLAHPPEIGYLTISNALQWRLQYNRVIQSADEVAGILRIHGVGERPAA